MPAWTTTWRSTRRIAASWRVLVRLRNVSCSTARGHLRRLKPATSRLNGQVLLHCDRYSSLPMSSGPDDPAVQPEELRACIERTLMAPGARIEFRHENPWRRHYGRERSRHPSKLHRTPESAAERARQATGAVVRQTAKKAWQLATRNIDLTHLAAEGIIDPTGRRFMMDFGGYAELVQDGHRFGGRSGRRLDTLDPWPERHDIDPLWLLDVRRGVTGATSDGEETVQGSICRRWDVTLDIGVASVNTPGGIRPPRVDRFEQLGSLGMAAWADGEYVRRVRFAVTTSLRRPSTCGTSTLRQLISIGAACPPSDPLTTRHGDRVALSRQ